MLKKITEGEDKVFNYFHKVQYYETDAMKITHHSNYIKWMESARIEYLEWIGYPYQLLERRNAATPVVGLEIDYKNPTVFGDEVRIETVMDTYTGLRFSYTYKMYKEDKLVCVARSRHCFTNLETLRPDTLGNIWPETDQALREFLLGEAQTGSNR